MVSARTEDNRGREGMQRAPTYRDTKTRLVVVVVGGGGGGGVEYEGGRNWEGGWGKREAIG